MRRRQEVRLEFSPDPNVPGFRRVSGGAVSTRGGDPLIGIDAQTVPEETPSMDAICEWLFRPQTSEAVPVAYFWDYACPFCRPLTQTLLALEQTGVISLTWHHTPIFGANSERVARTILAADLQGAGPEMQARIAAGRLRPSPERLSSVAEALGLDAARLAEDTRHASVTESLARSRGLARSFAFPGTPALVIGRTILVGMVSDRRLRALVERESYDSTRKRAKFCG